MRDRDDCQDGSNESTEGVPGMMPGMMAEAKEPRRREPTPARRRELLALACTLADLVEAQTRPHERCLLNRMVEMMVDTR